MDIQIKAACTSHRPEAIRSDNVNSVRGNARELVGFVEFDACLDIIITRMEERYDKTWRTDMLQQEFYQLQQEKGEKIHQFAAWLEHKLRK